MKNRTILIITALLILGCEILVIATIAYHIRKFQQDLKNMEARRPVLLYQTDHKTLLSGCRELSKKVIAGQIKPTRYSVGEMQDIGGFPQIILDLQPFFVDIDEKGVVHIIMSPELMYEVIAIPDNSEEMVSKHALGIMLVEGLWYYDEDFIQHHERMKEIEELLKERKSKELQGNASEKTL
jgi:hypothetical protein